MKTKAKPATKRGKLKINQSAWVSSATRWVEIALNARPKTKMKPAEFIDRALSYYQAWLRDDQLKRQNDAARDRLLRGVDLIRSYVHGSDWEALGPPRRMSVWIH